MDFKIKTKEEIEALARSLREGKLWSSLMFQDGSGILSFEYALNKLSDAEQAELNEAIRARNIDGKDYVGSLVQFSEKATPYTFQNRPIFEDYIILLPEDAKALTERLEEIQAKEGLSTAQLHHFQEKERLAQEAAAAQKVLDNSTGVQ